MSQVTLDDRDKIGKIKATQEIIREYKAKALALCIEINFVNSDLIYFQKRLWELTHGN